MTRGTREDLSGRHRRQSTFHPRTLNLPEERPFVHEPPPQQLSSSEHSSPLNFRLSSRIQTSLDLLESAGSVQFQNLLIHGADQIFQQLQCFAKSL